jgi:adenosylcobinamide-GDP ribazoletransferase
MTLLAALTLLPGRAAVVAFAVAVAVVIASGWYYRRRLGGITGDCLGATNQVTEVIFYLVAVAL